MSLQVKTAVGAPFAGMRTHFNKNKVASVVSEEASAEIPFGTAVVQGTADDGVLIPAAQANLVRGIVQHSHTYNKDNELGSTGLKPKVVFDCAEEGELYVATTEAVSPASAVRIFMSGGSAGKFGKTASAGVSIDVSKFCQWKETTTGSGAARLAFDFRDRKNSSSD